MAKSRAGKTIAAGRQVGGSKYIPGYRRQKRTVKPGDIKVRT